MWTALNGVTRLVLFPKGMEGEQPGKVSSVFASGQREVLLFGMCLEKFKPVLTFPSASHVLPGARKGSREGPWEETRANRSTPAGSPRGSPLGGSVQGTERGTDSERRALPDGGGRVREQVTGSERNEACDPSLFLSGAGIPVSSRGRY